MREYCCRAVENRFEAPRFARSPRATRASRATNPRPSWLVALDLAESREICSWRCAQSRDTESTAGAAVLVKMTSIPRVAVIV